MGRGWGREEAPAPPDTLLRPSAAQPQRRPSQPPDSIPDAIARAQSRPGPGCLAPPNALLLTSGALLVSRTLLCSSGLPRGCLGYPTFCVPHLLCTPYQKKTTPSVSCTYGTPRSDHPRCCVHLPAAHLAPPAPGLQTQLGPPVPSVCCAC